MRTERMAFEAGKLCWKKSKCEQNMQKGTPLNATPPSVYECMYFNFYNHDQSKNVFMVTTNGIIKMS